jgi:hypothetical protein
MTNAELQIIINRLCELDAISLTTRTSAEQLEIYDLLDQIRNSGPNPAWEAELARTFG